MPMTMPSVSAAAPDVRDRSRHEALIGLSRSELGARLSALGVPERQVRMRVAQLWGWLYVRGATSFAAMTDIAKELRGELAESFQLWRGPRS